MTAEELQEAQLELDKRRVAVEEMRARGEQTSAKRLLPIILPIAGTLVAAVITTGATMVANHAQSQQTERARREQAAEIVRTQIASLRQQAVENGQAAATMYFQNLSDLRNKNELSPPEQKRFARDLEIVAAISANDDLKPILLKTSREAAESARTESAEKSTQQGGATAGPSAALQGLPDLAPQKTAKAYAAADFLAYPEVPSTRWANDTKAFRTSLSTIGFATQLAEKIVPDRCPQQNEIRYYKPEHAKVAADAAARLAKLMHQKFVTKLLGGGATLPNGAMEFWLGTTPSPA